MAIAQGGHKPCVQAFGADQFDKRKPEEAKAKSSFFNWWYFGICSSVGISYLLVSYIQEYLSWSLGFGFTCIFMVIALLVFLSGTASYGFSIQHSDKNPFLRIGEVYVRAAKNWKSRVLVLSTEVEGTCPRHNSEQYKYLHKALITQADSEKENVASNIVDIEDEKAFLSLVPIWLSCLIYMVVCSQTNTFFTEQGMTMDRTIWPAFQIPAASLQVFISLTVIVFIPLYDRIFLPHASLNRKPIRFNDSSENRFRNFYFDSTIFVAALVEKKRLKTAFENGLVNFPEAAVPMSAFWLVPQCVLFGITEVFTLVGIQEFFYDEVASDMKSLGLALSLSIGGVGNFLSVFLIYVIEKVTGGDSSWLCNNLNQAHLDYFYFLLARLSIAGLVVY